ncbi:MAG: diphthine--ammonia ligase [Pedobacter sp.]|nr:MAG: diphthine--ammonia ligase [Pedobacter sp.]
MSKLQEAFISWSGGKDSCMALHYSLQDPNWRIAGLQTTISKEYNRISIHGVREELLEMQAESLNMPLIKLYLDEMPDMLSYETQLTKANADLLQMGVKNIVYGDIFLEDLRTYREGLLQKTDQRAVFPLWKRNTRELIFEFIDLGYKTIIVSAQEGLQHLCGKIIDKELIDTLPAGIDPCGENGEFHTFVVNGPIFNKGLDVLTGELVFKPFQIDTDLHNELPKGAWYIDLVPNP